MATKTKKSIDIKWIITNVSIIGMGISIIWLGMRYVAEADTKMFDSPTDKEKTRAHIDSDYNEVKNYKLMEEQKEMKAELDTAYAWVNARFKEDVNKRKLDSMNKADAIKSRANRDSLFVRQGNDIDNVKKNVSRIENAVQRILDNQEVFQKILDTIN